MRRAALLLLVLFACTVPTTDEDRIAAKADLTTRQLIAGLNAKNTPVLAKLIVVTSTAGGKPRALTKTEQAQLVYPNSPFEYLGSGEPGTVLLRDGRGAKRAVRLIVVEDELKVLATKEKYSTYTARETNAAIGSSVDADVVSFLLPAK